MAAIKELRASIQNKDAKRAWDREVKALQKICQLGLPHVVDIAAMIAIDKKQYFVFPWADGGSLLDLWRYRDTHPDRSDIATRHLPDIVDQLVGLTDALAKLHAFSHGKAASYRHGDLKPENILIFDSNNHNSLGSWKLADLGLARHHTVATGDQLDVASKTWAGTIAYQPPESFQIKAAPTSRLYDIWSMGCIILQLMTWLLYGTEKVDELTRNTKSAFTKGESSYWSAAWTEKDGYHNIDIHPSVKKHMNQMKQDLQAGGSEALRHLLSIVEHKLLVVKLPPGATKLQPGCRVNASDLYLSLLGIQAACKDQHYWFSDGNVVKQPSHLQILQGQTLGAGRGDKVSSNSLISKIQDRVLLCIHLRFKFR